MKNNLNLNAKYKHIYEVYINKYLFLINMSLYILVTLLLI